MKQKDITSKVALLKAGQAVEIDGNYFTAKRVPEGFIDSPCYLCNVDCRCVEDVCNICNELDTFAKYEYYLHLIG